MQRGVSEQRAQQQRDAWHGMALRSGVACHVCRRCLFHPLLIIAAALAAHSREGEAPATIEPRSTQPLSASRVALSAHCLHPHAEQHAHSLRTLAQHGSSDGGVLHLSLWLCLSLSLLIALAGLRQRGGCAGRQSRSRTGQHARAIRQVGEHSAAHVPVERGGRDGQSGGGRADERRIRRVAAALSRTRSRRAGRRSARRGQCSGTGAMGRSVPCLRSVAAVAIPAALRHGTDSNGCGCCAGWLAAVRLHSGGCASCRRASRRSPRT